MKLPKVDKIIKNSEFEGCFGPALLEAAKTVINRQRSAKKEVSESEIIELIKSEYFKFELSAPKPVINATGIVVHTNLGRSPISHELVERAAKLIETYSNLEYDLEHGKRGERYTFCAKLLNMLFGCEDALIVNNNAAAVFLVLNTFAKNREVVVSRGELVEIGGSFRVPEVMNHSGAILHEVGTTNKTHENDYENAINEQTAMLMKVHKSNYDIMGFSSEVSTEEIAQIAKRSNLISYYDLGSAYIGTLPFSLSLSEPNIDKVLGSKVDLVSFSGDKLFGAVQCGIILGKKDLIAKLKKNQLLRMLRVDKITLALLSETIKAYMAKEYHLIKGINQIHTPLESLEKLAREVASRIKFETQVIPSRTFVGGGTLPNKSYPTIALAFPGNPRELEHKFRRKYIIGRIEDDKFLLDFRSIFAEQKDELIEKINGVFDE